PRPPTATLFPSTTLFRSHTVAAWFCHRAGAMIPDSRAWSGMLQSATTAARERPEIAHACGEREKGQAQRTKPNAVFTVTHCVKHTSSHRWPHQFSTPEQEIHHGFRIAAASV